MKDNIKATERILKALANRRRLAIVKYLKKEKEATVGDIAEEIKISFTATSKHLGVLAAADITEKEQRSSEMWYRLSSECHHIAKYISHSLE
ncbi:MAG: winged helix-turn-helix transcriptional regulator [Candidatus Niyogibacteria bacterium]|nr:MAG: winged helix-turn-helix transcriptional regulator [Candidatus Niyogibacteria bacterium]